MLLLATSLFLSYSCKKDETVSIDACATNTDLISKSCTTCSNSSTKTNCEAYLVTFNKYLDSCSGLTTAQRAKLKADIASTKCQ